MHCVKHCPPGVRQSIKRRWHALTVALVVLVRRGRVSAKQRLVLHRLSVHAGVRSCRGSEHHLTLICAGIKAAGVHGVKKGPRVAIRAVVRAQGAAHSKRHLGLRGQTATRQRDSGVAMHMVLRVRARVGVVVCVWIRAVVRAWRTTRNNVTSDDVPRSRGQTEANGERGLSSVLVSELSVPNWLKLSSGTKLGHFLWYGIARVGVV